MWDEGKRETDFIRPLGAPGLAPKVSKFPWAISKSMQFRHLKKTQADGEQRRRRGHEGRTIGSRRQSAPKDARHPHLQ